MPTETPQTRLLRTIHHHRPRSADELHRLLVRLLGLRVPRTAIVPGNDSPFDYLAHTFFEGSGRSADCIVWASRGGGKTYLGAVATLLDLIFKPGIQIRILGGSMEQSSRMYAYLRKLCDGPAVRPLLASPPTQRRIALHHGSAVELLAQSQRSVRGQRIHKLRCDEVEEFSEDIWQAAQMVTRSQRCGEIEVQGSVEALSTVHRPFGLMTRLIESARMEGQPRVFRWCALDVIERCPPSRSCDGCPLWSDCRGKARLAEGFVRIDDLIAQKRRASEERWASEQLCARPQRTACVYPGFSIDDHVGPVTVDDRHTMVGGMDFGLRSPLVMLWAQLRPIGDTFAIEVFDEYQVADRVLEKHLDAIAARGHGMPAWIGVDPAGTQRSAHSGLSDIQLVRKRGHHVRWRRDGVATGIELIRRHLTHGTLRIDPRCRQLIEAMSTYHFHPDRREIDLPVKDGPDHLCDALRYLAVNAEVMPTRRRGY